MIAGACLAFALFGAVELNDPSAFGADTGLDPVELTALASRLGSAHQRLAMLALVVVALMQFGVLAFFALVHLYILSGPISEIVERGQEWAENTLRKP